MIVYVIAFQANHRTQARWRRRWSQVSIVYDGARAFRILSSVVLNGKVRPIGTTRVPYPVPDLLPIAAYGVPIVGRGRRDPHRSHVEYFYPGVRGELATALRRPS